MRGLIRVVDDEVERAGIFCCVYKRCGGVSDGVVKYPLDSHGQPSTRPA